MNATKMKVELESMTTVGCLPDDGMCTCCVARRESAVAALGGLSNETAARMDWAAGLTDEDIDRLKKGLVLLQHAAEAFRQGAEEQAITRLADELEALP